MRILVGFMLVTALLGGCSVVRDYQVGANTPLAEGELSPLDQAKPYADIVGYVFPPAGGAALLVITAVFAWLRGRRLNTDMKKSSNPITNYWNIPRFLEGPIQAIATLIRGLFEVGPDGSGLKAGWQLMLAVGIASILIPAMFQIPAVATFLSAHEGAVTATLGILASIIAGLQQETSKVLPLKEGVIV